jgi:hypothetical protein
MGAFIGRDSKKEPSFGSLWVVALYCGECMPRATLSYTPPNITPLNTLAIPSSEHVGQRQWPCPDGLLIISLAKCTVRQPKKI